MNQQESPIAQRIRRESNFHINDEFTKTGNVETQKEIDGGILRNYKKVRQNTIKDVLMSDYWKANKNYAMEAAKTFDLSSASEQEMMTLTKNFTMRHRLNRDIEFTEDFKKKFLTKEYGNFEKYEKNFVKVETEKGEYKSGEDKFYELFNQFRKRIPTGEAEESVEQDKSNIKKIFDQNKNDKNQLMDKYFDWKVLKDEDMGVQ